MHGHCDDCAKAYKREYDNRNREHVREQVRLRADRRNTPIKQQVLEHYSGKHPHCSCCGETHAIFLTVDHVNGDGADHRKALSLTTGVSFYRWLIENDFPPGFAILCMNCNFAKGRGFLCPHEVERRGLKGRVRSKNQTIRMAM